MSDITRPMPTITIDSAPYWESARAHSLRIQRCGECAVWRFYPTPVCPTCASVTAVWEEVSGSGVVYSYSEVYKPAAPAFDTGKPVLLVLVTLKEGPTMMADFHGTADELRIGLPVVLDYTDLTETITLPGFRAA